MDQYTEWVLCAPVVVKFMSAPLKNIIVKMMQLQNIGGALMIILIDQHSLHRFYGDLAIMPTHRRRNILIAGTIRPRE